jgi:hypothetical protein
MQTCTELVDLNRMEPGSVVDVETRNHHYKIECVGGNKIRISGHPQYCPIPVTAQLEGALNRKGLLDAVFIESGKRLLFVVEERIPVRTSEVVHVHCGSKDI